MGRISEHIPKRTIGVALVATLGIMGVSGDLDGPHLRSYKAGMITAFEHPQAALGSVLDTVSSSATDLLQCTSSCQKNPLDNRPLSQPLNTNTLNIPTAIPAAPVLSQEQCVAALPLDTKIGQVIMPSIYGTSLPAEAPIFARYHVGNAIIMTAPANLSDGSIKNFRATAGNAMMVGSDVEGGLVDRFKALNTSAANTLLAPEIEASTQSPIQAEALIGQRARALSDLGISMVFGPLADVDLAAARHGAMGNRTFSSDPATVTAYDNSYLAGWKAGGVAGVLKHFPGNGSTLINSDSGPAVTPPLRQLEAKDWLPYKALAAQQPDIMISNSIVPDWTGTTPASLSPVVYTQARKYAGENGLLVTDSLSAGAIQFPAQTAVVKALEAGADIALFTVDPKSSLVESQVIASTVDAVSKVVEAGTYPQASLDQHVGRILRAKQVDACNLS